MSSVGLGHRGAHVHCPALDFGSFLCTPLHTASLNCLTKKCDRRIRSFVFFLGRILPPFCVSISISFLGEQRE